jgi:hypothetical protein
MIAVIGSLLSYKSSTPVEQLATSLHHDWVNQELTRPSVVDVVQGSPFSIVQVMSRRLIGRASAGKAVQNVNFLYCLNSSRNHGQTSAHWVFNLSYATH